jgi:hypothetical protein
MPNEFVRNSLSLVFPNFREIPGWSYGELGSEPGINPTTINLVEKRTLDIPENRRNGVLIASNTTGISDIASGPLDASENLVLRDYVLQLRSKTTITHNPFLVPDWGALRFDLHVPSLGGGKLEAILKVNGQEYNLGDLSTSWKSISLIKGNNPEQVNYGEIGFETFQFEIPNGHL